ncbi:hypothetical protein JX265_013187 [Neoarthrinium moseri]|uniref:Uncharacterized protein n=1 Tax=Neoarthrinium moseri TaxID=1658444 RepID=A0A9P9W904_9PEZI|nr:hypothetical protein JX265_013187 [Neoarthrinium moseri]
MHRRPGRPPGRKRNKQPSLPELTPGHDPVGGSSASEEADWPVSIPDYDLEILAGQIDQNFEFPFNHSDPQLNFSMVELGSQDFSTRARQHQPGGFNRDQNCAVDPTRDTSHAATQRASQKPLDPYFRLIILNQNILLALEYVKSAPLDIRTSLQMHCHCAEGLSNSSSTEDPFSQTFSILNELEDLLRFENIKVAETQHPDGADSKIISLPFVLCTISCHLQVLDLYDKLLTQVLDQLSDNTRAQQFMVLAKPSVHIYGTVVPIAKSTVAEIFAHLMEDKIQPIESALGLPHHPCVKEVPSMAGDGRDYFQASPLFTEIQQLFMKEKQRFSNSWDIIPTIKLKLQSIRAIR